jgi:hypothetical protein
VSKEALQGPQGAPRAAEDFEKDYRARKSAGRDEDIENGMLPFFGAPLPSYMTILVLGRSDVLL